MSNLSTHWRDSARQPKFFFIEAQIFLPILLCLFHFREWTLMLCVFVAILLLILNYFKITMATFCVLVREWLVGREKVVRRK